VSAREANVLMAGVGGQGTLLASEILAQAALEEGLLAKQSEVHGVAQRGGSVVSHVRFGERVHSPLIRCGEADLLCAAEQLEGLRYAHYLRSGGAVVMDDRIIEPIRMPDEPAKSYPAGVSDFLRGKGYEVTVVPALRIAMQLGDKRCANVVLLGAVSNALPLARTSWARAMAHRLPASVRDLNEKAFEAGRACR